MQDQEAKIKEFFERARKGVTYDNSTDEVVITDKGKEFSKK